MKKIFIPLLVLVDLVIYLFLGLLMMDYEDFYTPGDGPWYSLASMTTQQKLIWFAYQGWFVLNGFLLIGLIYRWIKKKPPIPRDTTIK